MNEIRLSVRGSSPKPWGTNEWDWRGSISAVVRDHLKDMTVNNISKESCFEVDIVFYVLDNSFKQSDLDNLAKPVLDTLFHSRTAQVQDMKLTGALFPSIDDDRVTKLNLEKRLTESTDDQGAEILVRWVDHND